MRLLALMGFSLLLTSCATGSSAYYTQTVQNWRGANANELIKVWGKPDETVRRSDGTATFLFKRQSFASTNRTYSPSIGVKARDKGAVTVVTNTPNINTPWNRGFGAYCLAIFTTNSKGVIVGTEVQGTSCYVSQSTADSLARPKSS